MKTLPAPVLVGLTATGLFATVAPADAFPVPRY